MKLLHESTRGFLVYFAKAYPARTSLMVSLLVIGGLLEGVSVVTLVPLLEVAAAPDGGGATSGIAATLQGGLQALGIEPTLGALVAVVVFGITLKAVFLWLAMRQVGFTVAKVTLDLRLQYVRALLRARWSYFGNQPVGTFANSLTSEAVRSSAAYRESCAVLSGLVQIAMYLVISALISWQVTVVALLTGAFLVRGLRRFIALGRSAGEQQTQHTLKLARTVVDAMQGIKPLKAMAREERIWPLLEAESEELHRAQRRTVNASESLRLFQEPIVTLVLGTGLVFLLTVTDRTFSSIVVLAFIFYRLMTHINTLQMRFQIMTVGESAFWSLRAHIDEARAAEEDHPGTRQPTGLTEAIEIRNIAFAYEGLQVLDDFSARIPAGRITALIGRSGSGKTTILDLITGLQRPDRGDVYIDGVALRDLDLRAWRALIGYVPQEVFLFHDTVRQNITLGDDSISDDRVEQALKDSGAWEFIMRDPNGIDAMIAPQGSNLSGGQRQRLAIARALVKDPALIILDEATTGLDTATEDAILTTLKALRGRVTILAVSHQPALKDAADAVIELEQRPVGTTGSAIALATGAADG